MDPARDAQDRVFQCADPIDISRQVNTLAAIGVTAHRAGRFEEAAYRWREVLRAAPDHAPARRWLPEVEAELAEAGS